MTKEIRYEDIRRDKKGRPFFLDTGVHQSMQTFNIDHRSDKWFYDSIDFLFSKRKSIKISNNESNLLHFGIFYVESTNQLALFSCTIIHVMFWNNQYNPSVIWLISIISSYFDWLTWNRILYTSVCLIWIVKFDFHHIMKKVWINMEEYS